MTHLTSNILFKVKFVLVHLMLLILILSEKYQIYHVTIFKFLFDIYMKWDNLAHVHTVSQSPQRLYLYGYHWHFVWWNHLGHIIFYPIWSKNILLAVITNLYVRDPEFILLEIAKLSSYVWKLKSCVPVNQKLSGGYQRLKRGGSGRCWLRKIFNSKPVFVVILN